MPFTPGFVVLLAATLVFAYLNGVAESANIVAPVVSSRAIAPRRALLMTTVAVLAAPFLFGVAVAHTFGASIVQPNLATLPVVLAATLSAVLWQWLTWWWGIPSSSTHGLVGGLVGAGVASLGLGAVDTGGLVRVLAALFFSPAIGLVCGYLFTRVIYFFAQWATPRVNNVFRAGQILTAMLLALSWGANDAQKAMGLLALGLAAATGEPFAIPLWVTLVSVAAVALGALMSGWRLIRTLGGRFYRIRPVHGLAAQLASAGVIFSASSLGAPVSTTQVVSSTIIGAGAAERVNMVRWQVATDILWAWVLTIPSTALLGAGLLVVLRAVL